MDITERKQIEESLRRAHNELEIRVQEWTTELAKTNENLQAEISERREAEELYTTLANSSQVGIYIVQNRKFQFVNPKFLKYSGFSQDELLGVDSLQIAHPEDREMVRENAVKMLKGERSSAYEFRAIIKSGETRWTMEVVTSIQYRGERATLGSYMDITERKKAEEKLKESEGKYRLLFQSSPDAIAQMDRDGRFIAANPVMADRFSISVDELIGKRLSEVAPEEVAQRRVELIRKALDEGQIQIFEDEREGKYLHNIIVPIKIPEQEETVQVISSDITERKRSEEALQESEERLRWVIGGSSIPAFVIDQEHRIIHWNQACESLVGLKFSEVVATSNQWKAFYPHERPVMADLIVEGADEHKIEDYYRGRYTKSKLIEGAYEAEDFFSHFNRWLHFIASPIRNRSGDVVGALETLEDITERKRAAEALERSFIDLAETVSRATASRDPYTAGHERRVAELARLVGEKMGWDRDRLMGLYIGALLHDVGKASTPEVILSKPGKLSDEEWALIRAHTKQGYEILNGGRFPWPVADMAMHHHERLDGSGYPHGISADEISLENRILGVCDVVEVMSSHRPYRPARSREEVLEEIKGGRGTKYDANVVDVMLQIIESGEFKLGEG